MKKPKKIDNTAAGLRNDGKLWPENLSDDELLSDAERFNDERAWPISYRMVHDELNRRGLRRR